jgi:hypothetical protein
VDAVHHRRAPTALAASAAFSGLRELIVTE